MFEVLCICAPSTIMTLTIFDILDSNSLLYENMPFIGLGLREQQGAEDGKGIFWVKLFHFHTYIYSSTIKTGKQIMVGRV